MVSAGLSGGCFPKPEREDCTAPHSRPESRALRDGSRGPVPVKLYPFIASRTSDAVPGTRHAEIGMAVPRFRGVSRIRRNYPYCRRDGRECRVATATCMGLS